MNTNKQFRPFRIGLATALLGVVAAGQPARAQSPEIVIEWNQVLQANLPATVGLFAPRYFSMMHIAMFDAINSVGGTHSPYRVQVDAAPSASADAAAAQAARDVLVGLIPTGQVVFDTVLATQLANLAVVPAQQGSRVGQAVARNVLAWRKNDGSAASATPYVLPPIAGLWQPTPPAFAAAAFTQLPGMKPFALLTTTQYLPERPPTLTSIRYTTDFNEVKNLGSATSGARTADQTLLALQFAGVVTRTNLFSLWNNVARDTARSQFLSQVETARLYALLNVSISDALQTSHGSKFIYGLWRPVTAIQRAAEDLNSRTVADTDWLPLLVTPPYPSYAGNMACVGASAARALALVHGTDAVPFTAVWLGNTANPTDTSRDYDGFWPMALDEARSRVFGGIHFSFENRASQKVCVKVAEFAFANHMVPNN